MEGGEMTRNDSVARFMCGLIVGVEILVHFRSPDQSCINTPHKENNPRPTTDMIIRLGRLTPGYFRLLQRQVAGEVQTQPQDRAVNQIAMMLAIMGLSLSYYSAKRMTEKVQRLQKIRDPHTP